jgi:hypothetical protein
MLFLGNKAQWLQKPMKKADNKVKQLEKANVLTVGMTSTRPEVELLAQRRGHSRPPARMRKSALLLHITSLTVVPSPHLCLAHGDK